MTISLSPAVLLDFTAKKNDLVNFPFVVKDDNSPNNPINFSGFTSAKLSIKSTTGTDVISFSSTGTTYQIDISNRNVGAFTVKCDSLAINSDEYVYDFQLRNATQFQTLIQGKFIVTEDITQ